jgi:hypothetical protein
LRTGPLNYVPEQVQNIWAPHPFITIASAGNVNFTLAASETTRRMLDRVWGKMDARRRIHFPPSPSEFGRTTSQGSPYPGAAYECWSINYTRADGVAVGAMASSCGAEDYAWTAEATTVNLIREVVGFRDESGGAAAFLLRPALPVDWVRRAGSAGTRYSIRDLRFRGVRFSVHYTVAAAGNDDDSGNYSRPNWLQVRVEQEPGEAGNANTSTQHEGSAARSVEFLLRNARDLARVSVVSDGFVVRVDKYQA